MAIMIVMSTPGSAKSTLDDGPYTLCFEVKSCYYGYFGDPGLSSTPAGQPSCWWRPAFGTGSQTAWTSSSLAMPSCPWCQASLKPAFVQSPSRVMPYPFFGAPNFVVMKPLQNYWATCNKNNISELPKSGALI